MKRIAETKTKTSDAGVAVPPDLARDLKAWVGKHRHRRHADPTTTLRYYVKVIPENQRKAVADLERTVMGEGWAAEPDQQLMND